MNKAVFLDRDGTINVDTGYIKNPEELLIIRGAVSGVKMLKESGFKVFVVTNQSGVGRGYFPVKQLEAVNRAILDEFKKKGAVIDGIYFCPHRPGEGCGCRKPSPGMVNGIVKKYMIDPGVSYFIGDKLSDIHTGRSAGCRTVLISSDVSELIENEKEWVEPDYVAEDLHSAALWITKEASSSGRYESNRGNPGKV